MEFPGRVQMQVEKKRYSLPSIRLPAVTTVCKKKWVTATRKLSNLSRKQRPEAAIFLSTYGFPFISLHLLSNYDQSWDDGTLEQSPGGAP